MLFNLPDMAVKFENPSGLRRIFLPVFLMSLAAAFLPPAANGEAGATNNAALAWAALTNFSLLSPPMSWQTNPPTEADSLNSTTSRPRTPARWRTRRGIFTRVFPMARMFAGAGDGIAVVADWRSISARRTGWPISMRASRL